MSAFEFVLVLYAIIVGLGISDILTGWGEQIRARHRMSAYPLQIALSFLLMYLGITVLWSYWTFRDTVWSFSLYLALAIFPLCVSLASRVVRIDTAVGAASARDQYFQNSRPVFLILSSVPVTLMLISLMTTLSENVTNSPDVVTITAVRVFLFSGLLYLAWSKRAVVHWVGIGTFFVVTLMLSVRLTVRVIG